MHVGGSMVCSAACHLMQGVSWPRPDVSTHPEPAVGQAQQTGRRLVGMLQRGPAMQSRNPLAACGSHVDHMRRLSRCRPLPRPARRSRGAGLHAAARPAMLTSAGR